jgi:hypothetical protein
MDRRQQERGGARTLGCPHLASIMDGSGPEARRMGLTVMRSVCPPMSCHALVTSQQQDQPSSSSPSTDGLEQDPTLGKRQAVMSEDHARTARKSIDRSEQPVTEPFVGHQPQMRQHRLAGRHRRFYSEAHAR